MAGLLSAPPTNQRPSLPIVRRAVAEHDAPAQHPEEQRRHREHDEVLRENVHRVLRPAHAGFDAREAEVHEEHEHAVTSTQTVSAPTFVLPS